jgi:uncharacterized protein YcbK (DUF882 family)
MRPVSLSLGPGDPGLTRRQALRLAALAVGVPWTLRARAEAAAPEPAVLALRNLHTGEEISVAYRHAGHVDPAALRAIEWILRDHRTGQTRPIAPGLLDLLGRIRAGLATTEPFEVISGYRSPATNAMLARQGPGVAQGSLHMQGLAIDVRVPGRSIEALRAAALALRAGGVGYYPDPGFVHVDVGRRRWWCQSSCSPA